MHGCCCRGGGGLGGSALASACACGKRMKCLRANGVWHTPLEFKRRVAYSAAGRGKWRRCPLAPSMHAPGTLVVAVSCSDATVCGREA
eukprot:333009-Chlamydomonas_euryale.AAC.1